MKESFDLAVEAGEVQLCFGRDEALGPPPKTESELDGLLAGLNAGGSLAVVGSRLTVDSFSASRTSEADTAGEKGVEVPAHLDMSPQCLERKVEELLALFSQSAALSEIPLLVVPSPTSRYRLRARFGLHLVEGRLSWYTYSVGFIVGASSGTVEDEDEDEEEEEELWSDLLSSPAITHLCTSHSQKGGRLDVPSSDAFPIAGHAIAELMPILLSALNEERKRERNITTNLEAINFLSTLDGDMLLTLVYSAPGFEQRSWRGDASRIRSAVTPSLQLTRRLSMLARAKGRALHLDVEDGEGRDWVDEVLLVGGCLPSYAYRVGGGRGALSDGGSGVRVGGGGGSSGVRVSGSSDSDFAPEEALQYRQYEGSFSNPNGRVNEICLGWLRSVCRRVRLEREEERCKGETKDLRLLELVSTRLLGASTNYKRSREGERVATLTSFCRILSPARLL